MQIFSTYKQYVQTAHPDLILEVPFKYRAIVHDDEEVTILGIWDVDGNNLRTGPKSNSEDYMHRFIANIREHARVQAYQKSKQDQNHAQAKQ